MSTVTDGYSRRLIVVAEDRDDLRTLIVRRFTRAGYRAPAAGDEAMALIRTHHPDLCVLDIAMPGLSGLEITEQIRSDPELAETLIIFLTALASTADVTTGVAAGADDYMKKPFSMKELEDA